MTAAGPEQPFDLGLQNERTALAWNRTGLALLAAAVLVARLGAPQFGAATWLLVALGVAVMVLVLLVSRRRYRIVHRALHASAPLPDALLPTAVAALVVAAAVTELAAIVAG